MKKQQHLRLSYKHNLVGVKSTCQVVPMIITFRCNARSHHKVSERRRDAVRDEGAC